MGVSGSKGAHRATTLIEVDARRCDTYPSGSLEDLRLRIINATPSNVDIVNRPHIYVMLLTKILGDRDVAHRIGYVAWRLVVIYWMDDFDDYQERCREALLELHYTEPVVYVPLPTTRPSKFRCVCPYISDTTTPPLLTMAAHDEHPVTRSGTIRSDAYIDNFIYFSKGGGGIDATIRKRIGSGTTHEEGDFYTLKVHTSVECLGMMYYREIIIYEVLPLFMCTNPDRYCVLWINIYEGQIDVLKNHVLYALGRIGVSSLCVDGNIISAPSRRIVFNPITYWG